MPFRHRCPEIGLRPVKAHESGIVSRRTLHRARAKPHDHSYHSRVRIHVFHPFIRIIRASHARCHGHIEVVVPLPRDLLYQQRHLLVYIQKPPAPPVLDGRGIHGACIDASHGIHQIREPLFFASLIDAEDGFILAGKSVAESIFQETAGSDDDWRISIMPDHFEKFFLYGFGKTAVLNAALQFIRLLELLFFLHMAPS